MTDDMKQMTPEEYKLQLLKRSFAEKYVEQEDLIATLRTQLAMAQQELDAGKQDLTSAP